MIQAIMLIALGFLIASLIGVLLAPSLWSRASRLSKKRLESTLPLTLAEIEATQDQLRATYAVRVRRLESSLAGAKQKAANQLVDNSRLQMQIVALKDQIADLDLQLSERRNAATVLEQTITKRFPELDREITAVKAQLQERSYELQDLTSKLGRREEELAATQEAAASYQEELQRLHQVLERSAADRSGRRVRRASQWDLEDYRAEYDRLNLELSKLRQQLTAFQDRDSAAGWRYQGRVAEACRIDPYVSTVKRRIAGAGAHRAFRETFWRQDSRRERPIPWRQNAQAPMPLAARLKHNAETPATEQIPAANSLLALPATGWSSGPGGGLRSFEPRIAGADNPPGGNGSHLGAEKRVMENGSGRPKILQEVVTANSVPEHAEDIAKPAESEEKKPLASSRMAVTPQKRARLTLTPA